MNWLEPIGVRFVPANFGPMRDFDTHSRIPGDCGDTMEFWLKVEGDIVKRITYTTDGCETSVASGAIVGHLCQEKTFEEIRRGIRPIDVIEKMGLDETESAEAHHCADLALRTIHLAIDDLIKRRRAAHKTEAGCPSHSRHDHAPNGCDKSDCDSCCESCPESCDKRKTERPQTRKNLLVLSGKGGVGKSTVAVNLALSLSASGLRVGILDADIHGPSVPKLLGLENEMLHTEGDKLLPVEVGDLKVMSMGFVLERDQAATWRGPMVASVVDQFINRVEWGELDVLVVDCPPGTGDEHLTLAQGLGQIDGAIIVTTPQDLAVLDAGKAVTFCRTTQLPVLGVIENMSGFQCPDCQSITPIFRSEGGRKMAEHFSIPFLGSLPLDPRVGEGGDNGRPWLHRGEGAAPQAFRAIMEALNQHVG